MNTDSFKRMCRLIDYIRRSYINREWALICQGKAAEKLSSRHIYYLTLIRFQLPCNLNLIMQITGLSSSAASTFVEKMVQANIVRRETNDEDRRNVRIFPTEETQAIFAEVDRRLDILIDSFAQDCTPEELRAIEMTGDIICNKIQLSKMYSENQFLQLESEDAKCSKKE